MFMNNLIGEVIYKVKNILIFHFTLYKSVHVAKSVLKSTFIQAAYTNI